MSNKQSKKKQTIVQMSKEKLWQIAALIQAQ